MSMFSSDHVTEVDYAMRLEDYTCNDQVSVLAVWTKNGPVSSKFAKLFVDLANETKDVADRPGFYAIEWSKLDNRDISTLGIVLDSKDVVSFPQLVSFDKGEKRKVVAGLGNAVSEMKEIFKEFVPKSEDYDKVFDRHKEKEAGDLFSRISQVRRAAVPQSDSVNLRNTAVDSSALGGNDETESK